MCKSPHGNIYHAGILIMDVPQFRTERQAERWCKKNEWKGKGTDGMEYELLIHLF